MNYREIRSMDRSASAKSPKFWDSKAAKRIVRIIAEA